jgi:hypothetical protein
MRGCRDGRGATPRALPRLEPSRAEGDGRDSCTKTRALLFRRSTAGPCHRRRLCVQSSTYRRNLRIASGPCPAADFSTGSERSAAKPVSPRAADRCTSLPSLASIRRPSPDSNAGKHGPATRTSWSKPTPTNSTSPPLNFGQTQSAAGTTRPDPNTNSSDVTCLLNRQRAQRDSNAPIPGLYSNRRTIRAVESTRCQIMDASQQESAATPTPADPPSHAHGTPQGSAATRSPAPRRPSSTPTASTSAETG